MADDNARRLQPEPEVMPKHPRPSDGKAVTLPSPRGQAGGRIRQGKGGGKHAQNTSRRLAVHAMQMLSALYLPTEHLPAHVVCQVPDHHRVSPDDRVSTHGAQPAARAGGYAMTKLSLFQALSSLADALQAECVRVDFSPHKLALEALVDRLDVLIDEVLEDGVLDVGPPVRGWDRWRRLPPEEGRHG